MKKLSKKEMALVVKRSSEEIALQKAINAGHSDGCIPGDTVTADLSVTRFGAKKAPPFGSKQAAAKKIVRAAKRRKK